MNENTHHLNNHQINQNYSMLIEEIIGKRDMNSQNNNSPLILQKKKERADKCRDRFIGTLNQSLYITSLNQNTQKQNIITKQKNQLKSHKFQSSLQHRNLSSSINSNRNRLILQQNSLRPIHLQQQNSIQPSSSQSLSARQNISDVFSSTNLSLAPSNNVEEFSYSSQNLQTPSRILDRAPKINPSQFQINIYPFSCATMELEQNYIEDEIVESKEIQEELQDEQTCKYIELLKRGINESPLSKGSPILNGQQLHQKRKILNFSNNEISEDMKNAFSIHSFNNTNEKNSNIGSMNSFILSTITDASEMMLHDNIYSQNSSATKGSAGYNKNSFQNTKQIQPPTVIDTIELRQNMIEDDFYQNILDWCHIKKIAAMADSNMIHLTDFKTQQNDETLSNQMQQCTIDYLLHFQQLLTHPLSNSNSINSWSFNSSQHFLSSKKKQQNIQVCQFDLALPDSSTTLQNTVFPNNTTNCQNMNQIEDTEFQEEEDIEVREKDDENQMNNDQILDRSLGYIQCPKKQDYILNDDEDVEQIDISCFNLNTPSPQSQENKNQQQSSQINQSIFYFPPQITCPIQPSNTTYYSVLRFSPSGSILVAGRSDGIIEVYDLEKKQPIFTARCHSKLITSISINHQYIATASQDSKVVVFDIRDLTHITLSAFLSSKNSSSILALVWNPISENTLVASTESGHINLYNIIKDNKYAYKEVHLRDSSIKALTWNPFKNGILLAGTLDGYIFLIDLEQKTLLQRKKITHHIYKIIFSPNQKDRFVCLTGNQPETPQPTQQFQRVSVTSPQNQDIINDDFGTQTGGMFVLSYPQINKIHQVKIGSRRTCQGVLSYDNSSLYTLSKDNYLRQWKVFKETTLGITSPSALASIQELR